jgi:hypothetical protein
MKIPVFNDDSLMPLGRYRGRKLADVPADYLLWYDRTTPHPSDGPVQIYNATFSGTLADYIRANDTALREYIRDNMGALILEANYNKNHNH